VRVGALARDSCLQDSAVAPAAGRADAILRPSPRQLGGDGGGGERGERRGEEHLRHRSVPSGEGAPTSRARGLQSILRQKAESFDHLVGNAI